MGVVVALRCAVVGPGRRWLVRVAVLGRTLAWLGRGVLGCQEQRIKELFSGQVRPRTLAESRRPSWRRGGGGGASDRAATGDPQE